MPVVPKNPMPTAPNVWLFEIAQAYRDAAEVVALGPLVGQPITPDDLYMIAPDVCLKFRGIEPTEELRRKAIDAALASHVATEGQTKGIFSKPHVSFAIAYLASHFGIGLLDAEAVSDNMEFVEANQNALSKSG